MRRLWIVALCCLVVASVLAAIPAQAVPMFARQTGKTCQSCHFRPAELNVVGQDFMVRGFRDEPPAKPEDATAPHAAERPLGLPLDIQWTNYLSVVGHHDFVTETNVRPQFDAGGLDLWLGGPVNPNWTGIVNPSFDIENGGASVSVGYGQFVTKWANRFWTARFGQFQPYAIAFNQGGPSLSLNVPLVLSTPASTGNTWTPSTALRGVEVGHVDINRWNVFFGAATPSLDSSYSGDRNNIDLTASAQYKFGFMNSSVTGYGYWGHASMFFADDEPFHRLGAFFNIYGPRTKGTIGYVAGVDRDTISPIDLNTSGGFALVEQHLNDRWSAFGRYDWSRQDVDVSADGGSISVGVSGPAFGLSYWAATETWITAEFRSLSNFGMSRDNRFVTELTWAF